MKLSDRIKFALINSFITLVLALSFQFFALKYHQLNYTGLLKVGQYSTFLPRFSADFSKITPVVGTGHDGQFFYLIARNPFLQHQDPVWEKNNHHTIYRYRRILYPLLGGGFGNFSPQATLLALNFFNILALLVITFTISYNLYRTRFEALWIISCISPATYLCLLNLTADLSATALSLVAIFIFYQMIKPNQQVPTIKKLPLLTLLLTTACLAKEASILVAFSLGAYCFIKKKFLAGICLITLPIIALLLWTYYISSAVGLTFLESISSGSFNFLWPLQGLIISVETWKHIDLGTENLLTLLTILIILIVCYSTLKLRDTFFAFCTLPWLIMIVFFSEAIWEFGNNTTRVLGILPYFFVLASLIYEDKRQKKLNLRLKLH